MYINYNLFLLILQLSFFIAICRTNRQPQDNEVIDARGNNSTRKSLKNYIEKHASESDNESEFEKDNRAITLRFLANCSVPICDGPLSPIFCSGPLVTSTWYFGLQQGCPGSKLLNEPEVVMKNFKSLIVDKTIKKGDFIEFCDENFANEPYLKPANLTDWKNEPHGFTLINHPEMRKFADELNKLWPKLSMEFIEDVHKNQNKYPILSVPNRFMIPGGRFKVYFYWDTYWILKGLYFSELYETARGILANFAHVLKFHGFIPNSGNIQLSKRSQPPYFTQMIADYFEKTHDKEFLKEFLPLAEQELEWWQDNRTIILETFDKKEPTKHIVYMYRSITNCPRPENFLEDYELGIDTQKVTGDPEAARFFWQSTTSACESGWDFSSRWYFYDAKTFNRQSIATNQVLPLDLNVLMVQNYRVLANLYGDQLGKKELAQKYHEIAEGLRKSIDEIFWDNSSGVWFDFDLVKRRLRKKFYPTNILPLNLLNDVTDGAGKVDELCSKALNYLQNTGALQYPGGIPSSLEQNSREQWDFPNGWAPSNHLFVESLMKCKRSTEAQKVARKVADSFIKTAYNGLFNPPAGRLPQMWEKYDMRFDNGRSGFGGEYSPQSGFGWTNGVIMEFIQMFYTNSSNKHEWFDAGRKDKRGSREISPLLNAAILPAAMSDNQIMPITSTDQNFHNIVAYTTVVACVFIGFSFLYVYFIGRKKNRMDSLANASSASKFWNDLNSTSRNMSGPNRGVQENESLLPIRRGAAEEDSDNSI